MNAHYINGDRAEYTGNTTEVAGRTFYEVKIVEGHRAGELAGTFIPPTATGAERAPHLWVR